MAVSEGAARAGGVVVGFPQRAPVSPPVPRLTLRDRVETLRWAEATRSRGIARAAIHAGDGAQIGDFVLIYLIDALWASWVIGRTPGGYCLWRAGSGADIGCYPSLAAAFAAVEMLL